MVHHYDTHTYTRQTLGYPPPPTLPGLGDATAPIDTATVRASCIGSYRLWRDLGFVAGTPLVGQAADRLGTDAALVLLGTITAASAAVVFTGLPPPWPAASERVPG